MSDPGGLFLHLNREGRWPGFELRSLEAGPGGALTLAALPAFTGSREEARRLASLPATGGPEGLAVAPRGPVSAGSIFWTDAAAGAVLRRDPCDGREARVPLDPDTNLLEPRGLVLHPDRPSLVIADAGRHRLVVVALDGFQLLDVWGGPGTAPGRFDRPTGLAAGGGAVYVVDAGNRRVQKFDGNRAVDASFWDNASASAPELQNPAAVAVEAEGEVVWVLDPVARALFGFDPAGKKQRQLPLSLAEPSGLAVADGALYVGDAASRRLLRIDPADGHTLGEARGFAGPVAALAAAGDGLWVHTGGGASPVRLARRGGAVRQGVLWGGPIELGGEPHEWQRLQALGQPGGGEMGGGLVTFFVHATDGAPPPDPDLARLGEPDGGFALPWKRLGEGVGDVLVAAASKTLWVGAVLTGDGWNGPSVEQIRLSFDQPGYAPHLPPIYRRPEKVVLAPPPESRELLERLLALFEGFFVDVEGDIEGLRRLFDPAAVPPEWLDWLAGWLALDLDEAWPEAKKRRLLASAFESYAWRGTARGLARSLADRLGVRATIEEPHAQTDWWVLPADGEGGGIEPGGRDRCGDGGDCGCGCGGESRGCGCGCSGGHDQTGASMASAFGGGLGISTRLASASPQGAVLGTSAVLDGSHLIEEEDVGEPLFTDTAYQFSVILPSSQAAPHTLARVRELVEREKPAHTSYQICLVSPGIRVGFQALIGVDTILGGGPPPATRLGEAPTGGLGAGGLVLGGEPPGRIGGSRVGESTRLGVGSVMPERSDISSGARPAGEENRWPH